MTDKKTFKGFPLDSRGDVIGAFPTVTVIQEKTKDLINEVTGNINQMTIDYCLKFNIDPDVLIKQKTEIEYLQMKIEKMKCCINDLVHLGEFNENTDEEYVNYQVHEALKNAEQILYSGVEKIDNPCYHCYTGAVGYCEEIGCKYKRYSWSGDLETDYKVEINAEDDKEQE